MKMADNRRLSRHHPELGGKMAKYLNPKNDLAFKRIFGEHKHLCISLLNSMLPLAKDQQVVSIEYQSGELLPPISFLKDSIVDVRCVDNFGRHFIVEMQLLWTESFKQRVLLNASKVYVMQLDQSKDYQLLQPVYSLNFLDSVFERNLPGEYYHHYQIVNVAHTEKQIKGLEFIFIELPKFKPRNRAEKKLHELWLRFLTEIKEDTETVPAELLADEHIREALSYAEMGAFSKAELVTYDRVRDAIISQRTLLSEGRLEARSEGHAEGLAEGRIEGEKAQARAAATVLLSKNIAVEIIAEATGMTPEEITELHENGRA